MKLSPALLLLLALAGAASGASKRILVFTKAASWEQIIVHRDGEKLSLVERALDSLGRENGFEVTITKDGGVLRGRVWRGKAASSTR